MSLFGQAMVKKKSEIKFSSRRYDGCLPLPWSCHSPGSGDALFILTGFSQKNNLFSYNISMCSFRFLLNSSNFSFSFSLSDLNDVTFLRIFKCDVKLSSKTVEWNDVPYTFQATYCYFNQLCTCKIQAGGAGGGGAGGAGGSRNGSSTLPSGPGSPSLLQVIC